MHGEYSSSSDSDSPSGEYSGTPFLYRGCTLCAAESSGMGTDSLYRSGPRAKKTARKSSKKTSPRKKTSKKGKKRVLSPRKRPVKRSPMRASPRSPRSPRRKENDWIHAIKVAKQENPSLKGRALKGTRLYDAAQRVMKRTRN